MNDVPKWLAWTLAVGALLVTVILVWGDDDPSPTTITASPTTSTTTTEPPTTSSSTTTTVDPTTTTGPPDTTTISGVVSVDSYEVPAGHTVRFDPGTDTTLETSGNVVVRGTLQMTPDPGVTHTVRFVDVDESEFVGGGHQPLDSDVGLWCMESCRLDLHGDPVQAWGRGDDAPDDGELVTLPDRPDLRTGDIQPPLPETLRLDRTVNIEGTRDGRAHVMIRSDGPQDISHVAIRWMGVPDVEGRYPLHFHEQGDASRGTVIDSVVVRNAGNHAFVPHASHGITLRDTIALQVENDAYWWDNCRQALHNSTDDLTMERAVAASVTGGGRLSAFWLGCGEGGAVIDSVAADIAGSGYRWPEPGANEQVWTFRGNVAHHSRRGVEIWHNSSTAHLLEDTVLWGNDVRGRGVGVSSGAYGNAYQFDDLQLIGNSIGIEQHASSAQSNRAYYRCVVERASGDVAVHIRGQPSDQVARPVELSVDLEGEIRNSSNDATGDRIDLRPIDYAAEC